MHSFKSSVARPVKLRRQPSPPLCSRYAAWTIEELRGLAGQLQLRDANAMTRRELLDVLAGQPEN
jgi:hypothetical protein